VIRFIGIAIYWAGLAFAEGLRLPHRIARLRNPRGGSIHPVPYRISELFVMTAILLGLWAIPLAYAFTDWLQPLNYSLPSWAVWLGAGLAAISLVLRVAAHRSLAEQWSFTLETTDSHTLVASGIYSFMRHPIYAALILWAAAQPFLLQNILAGMAGSIAVLLVWLVRVPREERMMLDRFGDEYRRYIWRTGRLITIGRKRGN
jgi:protein-S-isoprenylcysteine O-methyltransferase Ste14